MLADRYLAGAVLRAVALAWAALGGLMVMFSLLAELGDLGRRDYGFAALLAYVALSAPRRVVEVLPAAALIGSVLGLGALAHAGELTALRAAGVSLAHMARNVLLAAGPLLVVGLVGGEALAPVLEARAEVLRADAQGKPALRGTGGGVWHREGGVVLRIGRLEGADRIAHVDAWAYDGRGGLAWRVRAASGAREAGRWVLHDAERTIVEEGAIRIEQVPALPVDFVPDPAALVVSRTHPEHLSLPQLHRQTRALEQAGRPADSYRLAMAKKLIAPVTTAVLIVLGLPLVVATSRSQALGQRLLGAIVIGMGFYLLDQLFAYGALAYGMPLALSAALPTLLAGAAAAILLARLGRT